MNLLTEKIQKEVEIQLSTINTSMPGTIVSYNAATNRAIVKPSIPKMLASKEGLDPPQIIDVPLVHTASSGGKVGMSVPIKPGDPVILSFQQRSLENWLDGKTVPPDDPRQFDLSDAVAFPGCSNSGEGFDQNDVVIKFDKAEVRIKPDGTISIGNENGGMTIDPAGNMLLKAKSITLDTDGGSYVLESHRHKETQSHATSVSGPPQLI